MKNIRRHGSGWEAYVRVNGILYTNQYDRDAPFRDMRDWVDATKQKFRRTRAKAGTLTDDIHRRYLPAVRSMPSYKSRVLEIVAWEERFGSRRRVTIEPVELRAQLEHWLTPRDRCLDCGGRVDLPDPDAAETAPPPRCRACGGLGGPGYSASYVKHRRTALMHLWHVLDGKTERNPVRDVPVPRQPAAEPRGLPYDVVMGIINTMPDRGQGLRHTKRAKVSKTKIRLRVMAWAGIPPAQIMKFVPARDFYLDDAPPFAIVHERLKGGGTRQRRAELAPQAVDALRDFAAHDCAGKFSTAAMYQSFQRACRAQGFEGLRPYDLRHSFLTGIYAATGDISATAAAGDHSTVDLTRRYTLAVQDAKLVAAIESFRVRAASQLSANISMQPDAIQRRLAAVQTNRQLRIVSKS